MSDLKNKIIIDPSKNSDNDINDINNDNNDNDKIITYMNNYYDNKPYDKPLVQIQRKKEKPPVVKKKKNKRRCHHVHCKNKLSLTDLQIICKCEGHFCAKHMNPHNHMCDYDNKKDVKEQIELNNPLCKNSKVVKI